MSFTYAELKTAIQDFTENNEPSFVRNIPLFIRQAEERILKNVQLNLFRRNASASLAENNPYLMVPLDFLAPYSLSTTGIQFPKTGSAYNIQTSFGSASVGVATPAGTQLNVDVFGTGRILGDVTDSGDDQVTLNDTNAITNYLVYKVEGGSRNSNLTDAQITYIEGTLLPYMATNSVTYDTLYDASIDPGTHYLDFKDVSFIREYSDQDTGVSLKGSPKYYAQFDYNNFILAPTPNNPLTAQLSYFYRPNSLTDGSDNGTTWLSENAEMALLYGSLIEAGVYMKEEPDIMQMYQSRFQESLMGIKMLGEAKQTTDEYRVGKVVRQKQ
jgi:hypothetical protein